MSQQDLYLLFEREGNAERHQQFPLAHLYTGQTEYHPYLGGPVTLEMRGTGANTVHVRLDSTGRRIPAEVFGTGGLPVHPQSSSLFTSLGQRTAHLSIWPTTSTRTLYSPEHDLHLKTSLNASITSGIRLLDNQDCQWAGEMTRLLHDMHKRKLLPTGVHFLPELQWISNARHPDANALIRGGLQDITPKIESTDRVIPASGLTTRLPFTANKTLLEMLVEQNGPKFFDEIARTMMRSHLGLAERGVSHESHAQNTLLIFNADFTRIKGICIRDVSATSIDVERLASFGIASPSTIPNSSRILQKNGADNMRRTALFTHCVLDSQISIGAASLIERGEASADSVRQLVQDTINEAVTPYRDQWFDRTTFYRRSATASTLRSVPLPDYRPVDNSLWGRNRNLTQDDEITREISLQ